MPKPTQPKRSGEKISQQNGWKYVLAQIVVIVCTMCSEKFASCVFKTHSNFSRRASIHSSSFNLMTMNMTTVWWWNDSPSVNEVFCSHFSLQKPLRVTAFCDVSILSGFGITFRLGGCATGYLLIRYHVPLPNHPYYILYTYIFGFRFDLTDFQT